MAKLTIHLLLASLLIMIACASNTTVNCVGTWSNCSNGTNCEETYSITTAATINGTACPLANNAKKPCTDQSACSPVNCTGGWGTCSNGTTCVETYSITRAARNGTACPHEANAARECTNKSNCTHYDFAITITILVEEKPKAIDVLSIVHHGFMQLLNASFNSTSATIVTPTAINKTAPQQNDRRSLADQNITTTSFTISLTYTTYHLDEAEHAAMVMTSAAFSNEFKDAILSKVVATGSSVSVVHFTVDEVDIPGSIKIPKKILLGKSMLFYYICFGILFGFILCAMVLVCSMRSSRREFHQRE